MCFSLFSLYCKYSKDRVVLCADFQPKLNVSLQECQVQERKGVFSSSMLHCDQGKRASAEKALCSPFFSIPFGKLCLSPLLRASSVCPESNRVQLNSVISGSGLVTTSLLFVALASPLWYHSRQIRALPALTVLPSPFSPAAFSFSS